MLLVYYSIAVNSVTLVQLQPVDKIVELMFEQMTREDVGYNYFQIQPGLNLTSILSYPQFILILSII